MVEKQAEFEEQSGEETEAQCVSAVQTGSLERADELWVLVSAERRPDSSCVSESAELSI